MYSNVQKSGLAFIGLGWGAVYHFLAIVSIFFAILAVVTIAMTIWGDRYSENEEWQ